MLQDLHDSVANNRDLNIAGKHGETAVRFNIELDNLNLRILMNPQIQVIYNLCTQF